MTANSLSLGASKNDGAARVAPLRLPDALLVSANVLTAVTDRLRWRRQHVSDRTESSAITGRDHASQLAQARVDALRVTSVWNHFRLAMGGMKVADATPVAPGNDDVSTESASRPRNSADLVIPIALVVAALILGAAAGPWGELPVNDDWSYSAAARALRQRDGLAYTDWTSMPLLPQILIGAAFTSLFGASETVLRASTLMVMSAGLVALYFAAREVGARPARAGLLSACVFVNPVFFSLSLSFMTDSFFFTFVAATCWAWLRYARTQSTATFALGTSFAVIATLQRQLGLALPLAFGCALFASQGISRRTLRTTLVPLAIVAFTHVGYGLCVDHLIGRPALWDLKGRHLSSVLTHPGFKVPRDVLARIVATAGYTGITLAPLLLPVRLPALAGRRRLAAGALVAVLGVYMAQLTPPFKSLIHPTGVGIELASTTPGTGFLIAWRAVMFCGVLLSLTAVVSGVAAFVRSERRFPLRDRERWFVPCFLLSFCVITLAPLLPIVFFDRYLLGVLPLLGILIAARHQQTGAQEPGGFAWGSCAAFAAIAVVTTQDSFAWNRARWRAVDAAMTLHGAQPEHIDAGFEHNERRRHLPTLGAQLTKKRPVVPELDGHYVVSFTARPNHEVVQRFKTGSWLHSSRDILLLARTSQAE